MSLSLLAVASRMRGTLSVGRRAAGPCLLKKDPFQTLRSPLAFTLSRPSQTFFPYRLASFSTVSDSATVSQENAHSNQQPQATTSVIGATSEHGDSGSDSQPTTVLEEEVETTTAPARVSITDSSYNAKYRKPTFTPELDAKIVQMREQGISWSAIGSSLGLPYRSCHRRYCTILDPDLQTQWSEERLKRMDEMVAEGKSWAEIASELKTTTTACHAKWKFLVKPKDQFRNRQFDTLQSKVLIKVVEELGQNDWKAVLRAFMMQMGGRDMAKVTSEQLRHQYIRLQRRLPNSWSLNEETALIQHVLKHGTSKWDMIAEALGQKHSAERCQQKWTTMDMKPRELKDKAWYKSERANFWRLWLRCGSDWEEIAGYMPRRPADQIESFFNKATKQFNKEDPEEFDRQVRHHAEISSAYSTHIWKKEESDRLWEVAEECKQGHRVVWEEVAKTMNMGLGPDQYKHHHYYLKTARKGGLAGLWTDKEVKVLEMAVQDVGRDWARISREYLPHRNAKALCHKFSTIRYKGAHILPVEYDTLMTNIEGQEEQFHRDPTKSAEVEFRPDWNMVAKAMPGRGWTADQCREAYEYSFKNYRRSSWSEEEDSKLLEAAKLFGRKNWAKAAAEIPGKNDWECRLRWTELHKPILEDEQSVPLLAKATRKSIFNLSGMP
ncbi:Myb-like DNA-binding domain protein [Dissophora globulifera]|nr:Myb-like DNA-binding domain protein [Dissophora globulifera]